MYRVKEEENCRTNLPIDDQRDPGEYMYKYLGILELNSILNEKNNRE